MKHLWLAPLALGLVCFAAAGFMLWQRYIGANLAFSTAPEASTASESGHLEPVAISLPTIKVNLPVVSSIVEKGRWPTTDRGVSYVTTTAVPGSAGNSVMYGHNWPVLLGRLPKIKVGDKIVIFLSDGNRKNFVVTKTQVVSGSDVEVLKNTPFPTLTIYTCTGFLDSMRFVATAALRS